MKGLDLNISVLLNQFILIPIKLFILILKIMFCFIAKLTANWENSHSAT